MKRLLKTIRGSGKPWNVAISNETYAEHAELLRYGLDWERFKKNFITYITTPEILSITLAPTTNAFSIRYFPQYIEWVYETFLTHAPDKSFSWHGSYITRPQAMDIKYLPAKDRMHIQRAISVNNKYKNHHLLTNARNLDKFGEYLQAMSDRIGSATPEGYSDRNQQIGLKHFLNEKQQVKQKDLSSLL